MPGRGSRHRVDYWLVICPQCKAENVDGKNFCSDCGFLLNPQLKPLIRFQVEEYVRERFKDQNIIEIETSEKIATRLLRWVKLYYAFPAAVLVVILALLGISDYSDFHKTVRRATEELKPKLEQALREADSATRKSREGMDKSDEAIRSINAANAKMDQQLASIQRLSDKVAGLESQAATRITSASKHVEERVTDLDNKVEGANKEIAVQQEKLTSTNELVTLMFSKGQVENFQTSTGDSARFVLFTVPAAPGQPQKGAVVYMLLKSAPIFQTVQINFHIFVQPKSSYRLSGNVVIFYWADPADNIKAFPIEVSYVPDPTYKGPVYSALSVNGGHIFADSMQLQ
jgi:hypothetical protein